MNNYLFELKIKELTLLSIEHKVIDGILVVLKPKPTLMGCNLCYLSQPINNQINGFDLINYYEEYKEKCTVPSHIASKCWLCPKCGFVFNSFEDIDIQ